MPPSNMFVAQSKLTVLPNIIAPRSLLSNTFQAPTLPSILKIK